MNKIIANIWVTKILYKAKLKEYNLNNKDYRIKKIVIRKLKKCLMKVIFNKHQR